MHTFMQIPVAMSMAVSFVSAITVIGYPVETYLYGLVILWMIPAGMVAATISALYYIPLIFRLNLHTIYQVCVRNKLPDRKSRLCDVTNYGVAMGKSTYGKHGNSTPFQKSDTHLFCNFIITSAQKYKSSWLICTFLQIIYNSTFLACIEINLPMVFSKLV